MSQLFSLRERERERERERVCVCVFLEDLERESDFYPRGVYIKDILIHWNVGKKLIRRTVGFVLSWPLTGRSCFPGHFRRAPADELQPQAGLLVKSKAHELTGLSTPY